ncbi:hypothetical protein FZEAL_1151 [Fusarium zealandicum]|uniref:Uncharacterized protein n=1 Tax=Fusarium zealandicum TaxID=1053134 RepID=A0A8H4XQ71_9HYPO|nr:hypothetical protein FZEAL_1151 [Fusarium zealandicum]
MGSDTSRRPLDPIRPAPCKSSSTEDTLSTSCGMLVTCSHSCLYFHLGLTSLSFAAQVITIYKHGSARKSHPRALANAQDAKVPGIDDDGHISPCHGRCQSCVWADVPCIGMSEDGDCEHCAQAGSKCETLPHDKLFKPTAGAQCQHCDVFKKLKGHERKCNNLMFYQLPWVSEFMKSTYYKSPLGATQKRMASPRI